MNAGKLKEAIQDVRDMIDVLDAVGSAYVYRHNGGRERLTNILDCLYARLEAGQTGPITLSRLDEYRKANKPVWVETTGYTQNKAGWGLAGTRQAITQDFWPGPLWYSTYMIDWVAYECPPTKKGT